MEELNQINNGVGVYKDSDGHFYVSPFWMLERFSINILNDSSLEYYKVGTDVILAIRLQEIIGILDPWDIENMLEYGFTTYLVEVQ